MNSFNVMKNSWKKPTANIKFSGESLKTFRLKIRNKTRMTACDTLFNIVLEVIIVNKLGKKRKYKARAGMKGEWVGTSSWVRSMLLG